MRSCLESGSGPSSAVITPQKRRSDGSTPLAKRQAIDTPTRNIISRIEAPTSPFVSVLEKHKQKVRVQRLTRSLKTLGRCVGRRSRTAIARAAVKDLRIRSKVVELIGKLLAKELTDTCSIRTKSLLRNRKPNALESFTWNDLLSELNESAPTTLSLLKSAISTKKQSQLSTTEKRTGRSKLRTLNPDATVALCCSILLRAKSQRMNLVQRLISVILYGGHASKQVYSRLQKLLICLSHKATLSFIDKLGEGHDALVHCWKEDLESRKLQANQQPVTIQQDDTMDGRAITKTSFVYLTRSRIIILMFLLEIHYL